MGCFYAFSDIPKSLERLMEIFNILVIIQVHHVPRHTGAQCPMQHCDKTYVYVCMFVFTISIFEFVNF